MMWPSRKSMQKWNCHVRATSLIRPGCVGGVPTEFYVRVRYVCAASDGFPICPYILRRVAVATFILREPRHYKWFCKLTFLSFGLRQ